MSCPDWEERIAAGGPEAAEHLRDCPSCAELAAGLERDARLLHTPPREGAAIDYAAIRAVARREAVRRVRRRNVWAALAVAAALLLASTLALHREGPRQAASVTKGPAAQTAGGTTARPAPAAKTAGGTTARALAARTARAARRRHAEVDLDRQFAEFLRAQYESQHPDIPSGTIIATRNPHVRIVLLPESKGYANE